MHSLTIRHRVPVSEESDDSNCVYFDRWLPGGQEQALRLKREGLQASLWVDSSCVRLYPGERIEDQLSRGSVGVSHFFVEIATGPISADLARFIREQAKSRRQREVLESTDAGTRSLAQDHRALGLQVQKTLLHTVNGFLSWAYAEKQQYWLNTRSETGDQLNSINALTGASAQIDTEPRILWCPPTVDSIHIVLRAKAGITAAEWEALGPFLQAGKRPSLVGELVSNADRLMTLGHHRAALIEAVAAMEVALNAFAAAPDPNALNPSLAEAIRAGRTFRDDVKHLGVTASIRYLLPVLLLPTALPTDAHASASVSLDVRHNIVHNGSRMPNREKAQTMVAGCFRIARALTRATKKLEWGPFDPAVSIASTPPTT